MQVYNSLTKQLEDFKPGDPNLVTMYLCGPTVYDYVTIGNFRTYTLGDLLHRILLYKRYKVRFIMNITDVGHLTGDNQGDADTGTDRMEVAAEREGKSAKDIANYYIKDFLRGYEALNLLKPTKFTKATDYISEQIDLVKVLAQKGFTYEISDGIYFDTSKFPQYGQLSGLTVDSIKEGARVAPNIDKKLPTDFALWKFSPRGSARWQEWDSPWGKGFPGWHLECSAMALQELGDTIDLHLGGEDLKMIHHQNEIAQSECATGTQYVRYWLHGAFLRVDGGRMGKSLGNAYTVADIESKGYDPLALRYFYMTAHYRTKLNFTWEALTAAQAALKKLYTIVGGYKEANGSVDASYLDKFEECLDDDINMPKAIAIVWDLLKSEMPEASKIATLLQMDTVLGLEIENYVGFEVPQRVLDLAKVRQEYRKSGIWDKADLVRKEMASLGFIIEDKGNDYKIKRKL